MKKFVAAVVIAMLGMGITAVPAQAVEQRCKTVKVTTPAVPEKSHTETRVVKEAIPAVPGKDAVPGFWQVWEPNRDQGPFDGPPAYPSDPRGTWSDKKFSGGPQQDAVGVYQNGNGNGDWFYRAQAAAAVPGTPEVPAETETVKVIDVEAVAEKVENKTECITLDTDTDTVVKKNVTTKKAAAQQNHPVANQLPATGGPNWGLFSVAVLLLGAGGFLVRKGLTSA